MRRILAAFLVGVSLMATAHAAPPLSLLEEVRKEKAQRSLHAFTKQAWHIIEPDQPFVDSWHIGAMAEHLEAVSLGQIEDLLINIPPGCMKSIAVSVMWTPWEWASKPSLRYLCGSYEETLAIRDSRKCRDIVQSEWYRARWPGVELRDDQNQKRKYDTTAGGWRIATSVGGRGTGEHPDRIIVDDPHNAKEAESDAERQAALDWFDGTLATRGKARGRRRVVIMQRLHELDLSGHILAKVKSLESSKWVHLCLPMRYDPKASVWVHNPLGFKDPRTEPGELLFPGVFNEEKVKDLEGDLGSYNTAAQLQQQPAPRQGGIFKRQYWRYYQPDLRPRDLHLVVLSVDTALKAKQLSDYSALQAWGARKADRFLLNALRERYEYNELKRQLKALYDWALEEYPNAAIVILIENTAVGPELIADMRDDIPGILAIDPEGDKVQRANAQTPALESGNVFLPGHANPEGDDYDRGRTPLWAQRFIDEHARFPRGTDDEVDACTQALQYMKLAKLRLGDVLSSGDVETGQRL